MALVSKGGFFQGGTGGGVVDRFTRAMDMSGAAVKRLLTQAGTATDMGSFRGKDYPMYGFELEAGKVLRGLVNLGLSMNRPAILALMSQGQDWLWDIRDFTPNGPPRPALALKMEGRGEYAERVTGLPTTSQGFHVWRREAMRCWMALDDVRKERGQPPLGFTGPITSRKSEDDHAIRQTREMLQEGIGGANISRIVWGDDNKKGSLWASIGVRGMQGNGTLELTAFSNNFYAGYVNDGFDHGLVPVIRRTNSSGRMTSPVNKVWAVLSIGWLGNYPIWGHESFPQGKGGDHTGQAEFFAFTPARRGEMGPDDQPSPGSGVVAFAKRGDDTAKVGIKAGKHQEGVHFFEHGTEQFLTRALPRWRRDVDRIIQQAWDKGTSYHEIDALYKRRVTRGRPGAGRFASK